jgi:hypothetical protein
MQSLPIEDVPGFFLVGGMTFPCQMTLYCQKLTSHSKKDAGAPEEISKSLAVRLKLFPH